MELQSQEREIISKAAAKRTMVGHFIIYTMLVPTPLLLTGHLVWAFFAVIVFVTFAYVCPSFFAPTEKELKSLMYNDSSDQTRADNPMGVVDYD
ncbi:MAG: hypothetical protein HYX67_07775 [Candidatus Melainabacteria bacterium]|nr:hypothetical protein [Candidatus Melainabacteria bacterium]